MLNIGMGGTAFENPMYAAGPSGTINHPGPSEGLYDEPTFGHDGDVDVSWCHAWFEARHITYLHSNRSTVAESCCASRGLCV